jgi:hypothetical protein
LTERRTGGELSLRGRIGPAWIPFEAEICLDFLFSIRAGEKITLLPLAAGIAPF